MVTTHHTSEHKNGSRHLRGYWSGLLAGLLAGLSIGGLSGAAAMLWLTPHTGKATKR